MHWHDLPAWQAASRLRQWAAVRGAQRLITGLLLPRSKLSFYGRGPSSAMICSAGPAGQPLLEHHTAAQLAPRLATFGGALAVLMTIQLPVPQAPEPDKTELVLHDVDVQLCELVKKLLLRIRAPIEGDAVRAGRLRAYLSLYDVALFLNAIGAGQDVANHFEGLATLFHDLNQGARPASILVPAPSRGNRPEVSILSGNCEDLSR